MCIICFQSSLQRHAGPPFGPEEMGTNAWWDFCQNKHPVSPQMIARAQVLVEASAHRNTCCDSSRGAIWCMQKSNDMPQSGSPTNENKIRALACFSCASIKVFWGLWFSCPPQWKWSETEHKANTRVDIRCSQNVFSPCAAGSFQPDWLSKQKESWTLSCGCKSEVDRRVSLEVDGNIRIFRRYTCVFLFQPLDSKQYIYSMCHQSWAVKQVKLFFFFLLLFSRWKKKNNWGVSILSVQHFLEQIGQVTRVISTVSVLFSVGVMAAGT